MVANLTTPLLGIVATIAIGRLGDATLLGGVAMASVMFDCLFWLFVFLRMSTVAFTAQALGAGEGQELRALLVRGFVIAGLIGASLIVLQIPLAAGLFGAMGGSEGVTRAAKTYFTIRIWSAPLALANYVVLGWLIGQARAALALSVQIAINVINMAATVLLVLVLDAGIAGAALAAIIAEAAGLVAGVLIARHLAGGLAVPRAALLDRAKLLYRAGRARRRRDARRQRGAEQFSADQRLLSRRPRQRRRTALRPCYRRARPRRLLRRDAAGHPVGICLCTRSDRHLCAVWRRADRYHNRKRRRSSQRTRLFVAGRARPGARRLCVRL
jgi:hypothetical protein